MIVPPPDRKAEKKAGCALSAMTDHYGRSASAAPLARAAFSFFLSAVSKKAAIFSPYIPAARDGHTCRSNSCAKTKHKHRRGCRIDSL